MVETGAAGIVAQLWLLLLSVRSWSVQRGAADPGAASQQDSCKFSDTPHDADIKTQRWTQPEPQFGKMNDFLKENSVGILSLDKTRVMFNVGASRPEMIRTDSLSAPWRDSQRRLDPFYQETVQGAAKNFNLTVPLNSNRMTDHCRLLVFCSSH